jgi:hypothetical protein
MGGRDSDAATKYGASQPDQIVFSNSGVNSPLCLPEPTTCPQSRLVLTTEAAVSVAEPVSVSLFGTVLVGLVVARRRSRVTRRMLTPD